ncbi:MAG: hypothetical protein R3F62_17485 [Planctomycetota bacterium]
MSLGALTRLELTRLGWIGPLAALGWGAFGGAALEGIPASQRALLVPLGGVVVLLVLAARLRGSEPARALDGWLASLPLSPHAVFLARAGALAPAALALACGASYAGQGLVDSAGLSVLGWGAALWLAPWRALAAPLLLAGALAVGELPAEFVAAPWAVAAGVALAGWSLARATLADPSQGALQGLVHPATRGPFSRHAWTLAALLTLALGLRHMEPAVGEPRFVQGQVTVLHSGIGLSAPAGALTEVRALLPELQQVPARVAALLGESAPPPRDYVLVPPSAPAGPGRLRLDAGPSPARQLAEQTARELLERRLGELGPLDPRLPLREGLVRYATWRATDGDPLPSRVYVAVAHARHPFALGELFDLPTLDQQRGVQVVGTLGEVWVAALVEHAGEEVLPRLLEAARAGVQWPHVLSRLRIDVDALELTVLRTIEAAADAPRAQVDLPRLFALDDQADHPELQLVAIPDRDVPPGWEVLCRARFPGQQLVEAVSLGEAGSGAYRFHVPGVAMWGPRPWVQLGLRARRSQTYPETIWEEWAAPPAPDGF